MEATKPNHTAREAPCNGVDLLACVAKDRLKSFKGRKRMQRMKKAKATRQLAKHPKPNVAVPLDSVANVLKVPQRNSQENSVQEQGEKSTEKTCTLSNAVKLHSNLPLVEVKSETSNEDNDSVDILMSNIPSCHASLLMKEFNHHPSLAICSGKTPRWRRFASETLGELLYFLSSTKGKEMTGEKCTHLEQLWEEALGLGFDLSWLESRVKFGLVSGSYLERQREEVSTLETKMKNLDEERDTLRSQLSTLMMLLLQNEQARADSELVVAKLKGNLKLAEESLLYEHSD